MHGNCATLHNTLHILSPETLLGNILQYDVYLKESVEEQFVSLFSQESVLSMSFANSEPAANDCKGPCSLSAQSVWDLW